ncbi:hypothetical protein XM25_07990 [Devosia sp. H5989]|nr:hypothetical protein XM25_07990 [Devosia sp. H5989]
MTRRDGYEYVMHIDEAGDIGLKTAVQGDKGSTEWFALGGYVASRNNEPNIAAWVQGIREAAEAPPEVLQLHYNMLDEKRRIAAATALAKLPIKAFVVLSHKDNMRGYRNDRAARAGGKNVFYNFCLRVMLERATQTVARSSMNRFGEIKPMKIVIAETGGVRYEHTMEYLEKLRAQAITGTTFLKASTIHPKVAASWLFEKVSAKNTAGCQIADTIASAFYNAVHADSVMPMLQKPAEALRPVMATHEGQVQNMGLKLLPWSHDIPDKFKPIFRTYGYQWER